MGPRPSIGAAVSLAAASLCWGLGTLLSKSALASVPAVPLLVGQLAFSVACLWSIDLWRSTRGQKMPWRAASTGLLEPGLAYAFATTGLQWTTASNAALLSTLEPVAIVALSALLLRERIDGKVLAYGTLALGGLLLVLLGPSWATQEWGLGQASQGDLLVLAGTCCAAVYVVMSHTLVQSHDPLRLLTAQQTVGLAFAVALWATGWAGPRSVPRLSPGVWTLVAASGIVQYALAFGFYLLGLQATSATLAGISLLLVPLVGAIGGALWLGEALTPIQKVGAFAIGAGVFLVVTARAERPVVTQQQPAGEGPGLDP